MKIGGLGRYEPLETALNETGFKVDEVEKQGKKTVITVSQSGQIAENPVSPIFKKAPKAVSPEK
jgi:hypothetical protein